MEFCFEKGYVWHIVDIIQKMIADFAVYIFYIFETTFLTRYSNIHRYENQNDCAKQNQKGIAVKQRDINNCSD